MQFQPGTYYIGDLGYVITEDETWSKMCDEVGSHDTDKDYFLDYTKYGDGEYQLRHYGVGFEAFLAVDSGTLGICPFVEGMKTDLGSVQTYECPFEVTSRDGFFKFGAFRVNTR